MPRKTKTAASTSHVVTDERFKVLPVTSRISIKDFVSKNGIIFAPGRGFYQLTKPETIQANKEVIAVRISDGTQISGDAVRTLLKIPSGAAKFKYTQIPDFEVYVQSTSYNRVLMPDSKFLYEVNPDARVLTEVNPSPKKIGGTSLVTAAHSETRGSAPAPTVPGSPIDLVFSFDTTGSMYSCLGEVRKYLENMISRILTDIPNIRIAVFAHGDYGDEYVTKFVDFSTDTAKLVEFVNEVGATSGLDFEECYELVLQEARTKLSWTPGSQRAMVMIGDAIPHPVEDYKSFKIWHSYVTSEIDWRVEADELIGIGCRVYAVQCKPDVYRPEKCAEFWQGLAFKTYGHHLSLNNFGNVFDFIMAIAYKEQGAEQFEAYHQEVLERTPGDELNADLHALFDSLAGGDGVGAVTATASASAGASNSTSKRKSTTEFEASTEIKSRTNVKRTAPIKEPSKRKTSTEEAPAKKTRAQNAATESPAKKAPTKKSPMRKAPTKKSPTRKAPNKKASGRKAAAATASDKPTVQKSPVKRLTRGRAAPKK